MMVTSLLIIGWVVGILMIVIGKGIHNWSKLCRPLHQAEVDGMRRNGLLSGEEEYMQFFRVGRAEGDQIDNERRIIVSRKVMIIGIVIISILSLYHLYHLLV